MPALRKYILAAVALILIVLWAGYTAAKRAYERRPHADIAGPVAVKADAEALPETVVTPHLECEITPGKNALWVGNAELLVPFHQTASETSSSVK